MVDLRVRPLKSDDRQSWQKLAGPGADCCNDRSRLFELGAFSGDTLRAGIRGYFPAPELFVVLAMAADGKNAGDVLLRGLRDHLQSMDAELLAWEPAADCLTRLPEALPEAGFSLRTRKLFVERELTVEIEPPWLENVTWASLAACGEEAFVALLAAASEGDPFEDSGADPHGSFAELKEQAGSTFDPRSWLVAWYQGEPCGVVLPQRFHDDPDCGTVFYIGVLPDFRGRRIGRHLHREGLRLLQHMGIRRYKGSTDERNHAMAAIFAANGCPVTKTQLFFKP